MSCFAFRLIDCSPGNDPIVLFYPEQGHPDGDWQELREFHCPLSGRLLETEAVPRGCPAMHEYLPDIEGFYTGWLQREIPS